MSVKVFIGGLALMLGFAAGYFVGVAQSAAFVLSQVSK